MRVEEPTLPGLVEVLRAEQRRRWQEGERVPVESYFALHPRLLADSTSALQMVYNEVLLRERDGESPEFEEYVRRFPQFACQLAPLFEVHRALESDQLLVALADNASPAATLAAHGAEAPGPAPTVAGYEILGELGRGGMGVVYKARRVGLSRVIALKMILAGNHANPAQLGRFRAEAEAVARLQHPNIVQIYDVGEQDGRPYFSMEFVNGRSLAQELNGSPQPARAAAGLIQTLARAIYTAHQKGIIHRDLKPANILLQKDEGGSVNEKTKQSDIVLHPASLILPKITDFGLAKQLDGGLGQTCSGMVIGTPSYMAPEQANSQVREVGPAADIYALGAILYELLTGRPPFKAATQLDTLRQVLADEPVPLSRFHLKVPGDLNTICMKCLQKEPHKRYASALALAEDLERFLAGQPIRARRAGLLERMGRWCRRQPVLALVTGLAVTAFLGVIGISICFGVSQYRAAARLSIALEEARNQRRQADELAVSLSVDHALTLCEQGDVSQGLLLLAWSLEKATQADVRGLQPVIRANLAAWREQLHPLLMCLPEEQQINTLAFNLDAKQAATGGSDSTVRIWDLQSGSMIRTLRHDTPVLRVLFTPGGSSLLTVTAEAVQLWDKTFSNPRRIAAKHSESFVTAALSADNSTLVTGTEAGSLEVWDVASGTCRVTISCHTGRIQSVAFSPDSARIVTGGADQTARLWEATRLGAIGAPLLHDAAVLCVAFSPDGQTIATGSRDWKVRLWDPATGKLRFSPLIHKDPVTDLAFSPNGKLLLTGCLDGQARLWETATGQQLRGSLPHAAEVRAVAFSPDGNSVLTGGQGGVARLWKVVPIHEQRARFMHPNWLATLAFGPEAGILAAGGDDPAVRLWNGESGQLLRTLLPAHEDNVRALAFTPDGKLLLSGGGDHQVRLWEVATGRLIGIRWQGDRPVSSLAISPDSQIFLVGMRDGNVEAGEITSGKSLGKIVAHQGPVRSLALSPDGKTFLTSGDQCARLWMTDTRQPLGAPLRHQGTVGPVAFSPDGQTIFTGGGDKIVRSWKAGTGEALHPAISAPSPIRTIALSPDGRTLLIGCWNGSSRLWDVATRKPLGATEYDYGPVLAAAFARDGSQILIAGEDKTIRRWQVPRPIDGGSMQILLWTQVLTGLELDAPGETMILDVQSWKQRAERLRALGGPPN